MVSDRSSRADCWTNLRQISMCVFFNLKEMRKNYNMVQKTQKAFFVVKKKMRSYMPHTKVENKQMFLYNVLKFN